MEAQVDAVFHRLAFRRFLDMDCFASLCGTVMQTPCFGYFDYYF